MRAICSNEQWKAFLKETRYKEGGATVAGSSSESDASSDDDEAAEASFLHEGEYWRIDICVTTEEMREPSCEGHHRNSNGAGESRGSGGGSHSNLSGSRMMEDPATNAEILEAPKKRRAGRKKVRRPVPIHCSVGIMGVVERDRKKSLAPFAPSKEPLGDFSYPLEPWTVMQSELGVISIFHHALQSFCFYFDFLKQLLVLFISCSQEWCDIPHYNSNEEEYVDQLMLKMSISHFFYSLVKNALDKFPDVFGVDVKTIARDSKLYVTTGFGSTVMKEIGSDRELSKFFLEQSRKKDKVSGNSLIIRAGIGHLTNVETAIDQEYLDAGAGGENRFSLLDQQETAVKMTGAEMLMTSMSDPFVLKDWLLDVYKDPECPVYFEFTEQMKLHMLGKLIFKLKGVKGMGKEELWKPIHWWQAMFRPGSHGYKMAGDRVPDQEAFPPVNVNDPKPTSLPLPEAGSGLDANNVVGTVRRQMGVRPVGAAIDGKAGGLGGIGVSITPPSKRRGNTWRDTNGARDDQRDGEAG